MPKIDINAAPTVNSLISTQRASGSDFGGGEGLKQAGAAITSFADNLKKQADRETAVEIETSFIEARTQLLQRSLKAQKEAPAGAAGFTEAQVEEFNQTANSLRERYANASPENKLRLEQSAARLGSWYSERAMVFESTARAKKVRRDAENSLETVRKSVLDGTMSVEDAQDASLKLVDATGLGGDDREVLIQEQNESIAVANYTHLMRSADTPQEVLALKSELEKNKESFSAAGYNKLLSDLDTAADTLERQNREEDRADFAQDLQSGSTGGPMEEYSREDIQAMFPGRPRKAQRAIAAYENARKQQAIMVGVSTASTVDIARQTAALQKKVDDAVSADARIEAEDNLSAFKQAASRRQTEVDKNPIAYSLKNFPIVADAREQMKAAQEVAEKNPEDENAATQAQFARDKYIGAMDAVQARLGVVNPDILTENEVEAYGVQISDALRDTGDGKGAARILQVLDGLQAKWGSENHWARVTDQLVRKKAMTGGHVALAWMDPVKDHVARIKLADALAVPKSDWEKGPVSTAKKDIDDAVVVHLTDFAQSMANSGGARGIQLSGNMFDAVSALAKDIYSKQGGTAEKAAQEAYDTLLGDKFKYFGEGSARVPVAEGVDFDLVATGAMHYKRKALDDVQVRLPANDVTAGGGEMDRSAYLSVIASRGRWVNSGDGTGLTLVGPDGTAVMTADDPDADEMNYAPLSLTWEELTAAGYEASAQRGRGGSTAGRGRRP